MSTRETATEIAITQRTAIGASVICLIPAVFAAVVPGWVIGLL
jgi:hypothetical protein